MTETPEIQENPALSPGFDRARKLSRVLVIALTICLIVGVIAVVGITAYMFSPELQALIASHSKHAIPELRPRKYIFVVLAAVPYALALLYARKLFAKFAAGEVFTTHTIGILRTAALWLTVSGFIPFQPLVLIAGIATYIAAYVMVEACRLADEAAGIV